MQYLTTFFLILSALYWFRSATMEINVTICYTDNYDNSKLTQDDIFKIFTFRIPEANDIAKSLRISAFYNAVAAACAALAAITGAFLLFSDGKINQIMLLVI